MFSETTVDWIRGKRGADPVKTMEDAVVMFDGVAQAILLNMAKSHLKNKENIKES